MNVLNCCKTQKNAFLLKTQCSLLVRLVWWHIFLQSWIVYSILRHPAFLIRTARLHSSDGRLRNMGMCSCLGNQMVPMAVALRVVRHRNCGKRAGPKPICMHHLGKKLCHRSISFQCDNESLVAAIKKTPQKMLL